MIHELRWANWVRARTKKSCTHPAYKLYASYAFWNFGLHRYSRSPIMNLIIISRLKHLKVDLYVLLSAYKKILYACVPNLPISDSWVKMRYIKKRFIKIIHFSGVKSKSLPSTEKRIWLWFWPNDFFRWPNWELPNRLKTWCNMCSNATWCH